MPYKEDVIALVDVMHDFGVGDRLGEHDRQRGRHAARLQHGLQAVADLLRSHAVPTEYSFAVAGAGGMAKAVVAALRDSGFGRAR